MAISATTMPALALYDANATCDSYHCLFAQGWNLEAYGAARYLDRGAYGYFHSDLYGVEVKHPTGYVPFCAGGKSTSDGGGSSTLPIGFVCTGGTDYLNTHNTPSAGWATIANYDGYYHYDFYGTGWKTH
jgi:hypothetical protein